MKKLFTFFLLLFLLVSPSFSAYAFVASGDNADAGSSSTLTITGVTFGANETVFLHITYGDGTELTETITDGTNTYEKVGSTIEDVSDNQLGAKFICKNTVAGTYNIVLTLSASVYYRGIRYCRYTGLDNSGTAQDVSDWRSNIGTGTDALTTSNITPSSQPGILWGCAAEVSGSASVPTAGTFFTTRGSGTNWSANIGQNLMQDRRITSTSAVASTMTLSSATNQWLVGAIFFPEASGGGGGGSPAFRGTLLGVGK